MDYSHISGIGVQVVIPNEWEDQPEGYLWSKVGETNGKYYDDTGGNHITAENLRHYILIANPLKDGFNIKSKINTFQDWLKKNDIEYKGNVDIVGDFKIS